MMIVLMILAILLCLGLMAWAAFKHTEKAQELEEELESIGAPQEPPSEPNPVHHGPWPPWKSGYRNWMNQRCYLPVIAGRIATMQSGANYMITGKGWLRVRKDEV